QVLHGAGYHRNAVRMLDMPHIVALSPERIVYVSCNPTTLARDSQVLHGAGYHRNAVRMLDMFPQTGHLESMVLFTKTPPVSQ
ncbi:hypothetical protein UA45_20030, partial [Morganella morganii]